MTTFTEIQSYSPALRIAVSLLMIVIVIWVYRHLDLRVNSWIPRRYRTKNPNVKFTGTLNKKVLFPIIALPFAFLAEYFMSQRLYTSMDETGIHYHMWPTQRSDRTIPWADISYAYIRDGIPYPSRGSYYYVRTVYTLADSYGICFKLTDGTSFMLGTKRPEDAKSFLNEMGQQGRVRYVGESRE